MEAGTGEKLQDCDVDNRRRRYSITAQHASHAHPIHILDNAGATKVRTWPSELSLAFDYSMRSWRLVTVTMIFNSYLPFKVYSLDF